MANDSQYPMRQYMKELEALDSDPVDEVTSDIRECVANSDSSRSVVYRKINPMFSVHPMFHSGVCETYRADTTRHRLGSHRLKMETEWLESHIRNVYVYVEMGMFNQNYMFLFNVNIPET